MNRSLKRNLLPLLLLAFSASLLAQSNFGTSIHATRKGKAFWYNVDNASTGAPAPGFEILTGVPIDNANVACVSCHPGNNLDANGVAYATPYPGMSCNDCHATNTTGMPVDQEQCYDCHGRQKTEAVSLGYSDVHRDASNPLLCWDCHKKEELHGDDGVEYSSMLEPGAVKVDCQDCHASNLPANHSSYDPHNGKLHCDACHAQTVISCYNCHFESQVEAHNKRAKQPLHDFVMLANREKDGKVGTMSFQSLTYQGDSWVAFGPFHSHSITAQGRVCADCHNNIGGQNPAILEYNQTGEIQFARWDDTNKTLSWLHGVVPMPADYQTSFKMDFITYDGDVTDPVGPSSNWSSIGENTWDGHQMFFATPLTQEQMLKLGFLVAIDPADNAGIPEAFQLKQNYPNPFNPSTVIEFHLPNASAVTLTVHNLLGEVVATMVNGGTMSAGIHKLPFNAKDLANGVYIYRIQTETYAAAKKMILMK